MGYERHKQLSADEIILNPSDRASAITSTELPFVYTADSLARLPTTLLKHLALDCSAGKKQPRTTALTSS